MFGSRRMGTVKSSAIASVVFIACKTLVVITIAAIIVLALIPVYLENNSVSTNAEVLSSQEITMSIEVEQNDSVISGRRKRDIGDLYDYVSGQLDDTGKKMIKNKLLPVFPSNTVSDLSISDASLGYESVSRRRRFALSKRAAYVNHPIVLVIKFYIIYLPRCIYRCQTNEGPVFRRTLYNMLLTPFVFTNIPIYKNGVFYKNAPRIKFVSVIYVSQILPGVDPFTLAPSNVTITLTSTTTISSSLTTTTAASMTPAFG